MIRLTPWLAAVAVVCAVGSCGSPPESSFDGWWLVVDPEAVAGDLDRLEAFAATPAAAWASDVRSRLADCPRMVATAPEPDGLIDAMRCVGEERLDLSIAEALTETETETELAWAIGGPVGGVDWIARARLDGSQTVIEVELSGRPRDVGAVASLLPRAADVGAPRFGGPLLIHGRFGADGGLDPASWVGEGSAGDRLFGLRQRLFSGALLTGVWELAVPAPLDGESMLPLVLAIETRGRLAARPAVESFVAEMEQSWGLRPTAAEIAGRDGACFDELRVLPAFEPCWALLDDTLVVGWNAAALDRALVAEPAPAETADRPSRLVVHLDRFAAADATLAAAIEASPEALPGPYPWRRWTIEGRRDGEAYRITVVLDQS